MRIWPGSPYPLGATWDGEGVNFALFSENATAVDLCLFGRPDSPQETHRIRIEECTDFVWHVYLPEIRPGQLYGYRVHGLYEPEVGLRFNPAKVLIDPYAKAIAGNIDWSDALFGYRIGDPKADLSLDDRDNAGFIPKCVVVDQAFTWGGDQLLRTAWDRTVIYEVHVHGYTARHPDVPKHLRGTYAGLATPEVIEHLQQVGVTAVELLPVHHFTRDHHLIERGLTNYWGYNSIGFFAPDIRYATSSDSAHHVWEFKTMVKALHNAGIEVILDVVYNHTGEGNHLGPTLSFRGIDNASYYRLVPDHPRYYHGLHRHRQHAERPPSPDPAAHHGQPAVLGARNACGRLPIRSRLHAGEGAARRGPAQRVFRHHSSRSGALPSKTDRRTLGLGRRRLSGRQLSGRLGRVERQVSRRYPALLERRRGPSGGAGLSAVREQRSLRRTAAGGPMRASISSRRTTDSRLHDLVCTTRSTTRPTAKTIATAPTTISAGTAAWKDRRRSRQSSRCANDRSATCWPRCSCHKGSRCSAAATKWDGRSVATTTLIARTMRSVGWTGR